MQRSVLEALQPFEWSAEDAVSFEVAQDILNHYLAECTARYWAERRRAHPRPAMLAHWDGAGRVASQVRRALRYDDPEGNRAAIAHYGRLIRVLTGDPV